MRWVNDHFSDSEKARALAVLRTAIIHLANLQPLDYSDALRSVLKACFSGLKYAFST